MEECFNLIVEKARAIDDPFEAAFFLMVHLPYLQPFEDVNKRVSRLGANIPFVKNNLCPLSFIDVPERAYVDATLGVYEMTRYELLRDLFVWAYERSCARYVVVRDSVAEPDVFRMRHREALIEVVSKIVKRGIRPDEKTIRTLATRTGVAREDIDRFVGMVSRDFTRLYEGNIAVYRLKPAEFEQWRRAVEGN